MAKLNKINRKEKINSNDRNSFEIQCILLSLQKNKNVWKQNLYYNKA